MRTKIVEIPPEIFTRKKHTLEIMYELFVNNPNEYFIQYEVSARIKVAASGTFVKQLHILIKEGVIEEVNCPTCKRNRVYRLKPKGSQKKKKHN